MDCYDFARKYINCAEYKILIISIHYGYAFPPAKKDTTQQRKDGIIRKFKKRNATLHFLLLLIPCRDGIMKGIARIWNTTQTF